MTFYGGNVYDVEVYGDEDGFHMKLDTSEGEFDFLIHSVAQLLREQTQVIANWYEEGEDARRTYVPRVTQDDLDAYPLGDPKRITLEREMRR